MDLLYFVFFILFGSNFKSITVGGLNMEKIIGGVKSSRYRFKYVAALMYKSADVPDINPCTASILSNFHIITVADCFYTKPWGQLRNGYFYIIAGAPDLKEPLRYTRYIGIDTVTIHKHYNPLDLDCFYSKANLAIGKLKKSLGMQGKDPAISSLGLRYRELSMPFPALFVSGYGLHEVELVIAEVMGRHDYLQLGESDGKLRYGVADLLNNTYCEGIIGKSLARGNLCAKMQRKEPEQPTGICLGDSGAPLVLRDSLIGIAITGFLSCDEEEYPGIYVDAYYYRAFISSVLDNVEFSEKYVFQIQEHQPNIFKFVQVS